MTGVELDGSLLGLVCGSSVVSIPAVDLVQNHHKGRDEHMVNAREHGNIERVLSQQHSGGSVLPANLQQQQHQTANKSTTITVLIAI
jgi:hypothetical protein